MLSLSLTRNPQASQCRLKLVGDWVCKLGSVTGYTCGQIASKSYNLLGSSGFVQVHDPDNRNMSAGRDSGGPYYDEYTYPNSAWGSHSDSARSVNANDAVSMPISYISDSKLAVLTDQ